MFERFSRTKSSQPKIEAVLREPDAARVAEEAIDMARKFADSAERSAELARTAVALLGELALLSEDLPLGAEELKVVAQRFPRWNVSQGILYGEAQKSFTRSLDDISPLIANTRSELHLTDTEYFDAELMKIFNTTSGEGDLGSFPHFSIYVIAGPIVASDITRIAQAEAYLIDNGYVVQTEDSPSSIFDDQNQ